VTPEEMQKRLRERGYAVPVIVIRTWRRDKRYGVHRNAWSVERWLLREPHTPGRPPRFPQFLAHFATDIQHYIQESTPRLPR
jgi:hypothetical protein